MNEAIEVIVSKPFESGLMRITEDWVSFEVRKPKDCAGPREFARRVYFDQGKTALGELMLSLFDPSLLPVWPRGGYIVGYREKVTS